MCSLCPNPLSERDSAPGNLLLELGDPLLRCVADAMSFTRKALLRISQTTRMVSDPEALLSIYLV